jgi:selenocysteine-specific elongation factor
MTLSEAAYRPGPLFVVAGEVGVIEGGFGQSGKFKVAVRAGLSEPLRALYAAKGKAKEKEKAPKAGANDEDDESASATSRHDAGRIVLRYKRYVYAPTRKLIQ